jgi:hypothetical protein
MTAAEAAELGHWAAQEGWNPGTGDLEVAWAEDPEAFIGLRHGDQLVGGGSILSYSGAAGFMGLFILQPGLRRQGLGAVLWHERLRRLRARLQPGAPIGMDGVFHMAAFYARGGFRHLYRDLRFEGVVPAVLPGPLGQVEAEVAARVGDLQPADWTAAAAYDASVFGVPRASWLRRWVERPGVRALLSRDSAGQVNGLAVRRPALRGAKLGPVFANDAATAAALLAPLLAEVAGDFVQWDLPEPNAGALALVHPLGWSQPFGCARMVEGPTDLPGPGQVFGVSSFEFG